MRCFIQGLSLIVYSHFFIQGLSLIVYSHLDLFLQRSSSSCDNYWRYQQRYYWVEKIHLSLFIKSTHEFDFYRVAC